MTNVVAFKLDMFAKMGLNVLFAEWLQTKATDKCTKCKCSSTADGPSVGCGGCTRDNRHRGSAGGARLILQTKARRLDETHQTKTPLSWGSAVGSRATGRPALMQNSMIKST
jgi:hypothetical protein